jgi:putative glutamine amidotransferase
VPNYLGAVTGGISQGIQAELYAWLRAIRPSAVVLSGGNNIGDFPERDATESSLLAWAEEMKIPVLGICRGMQLISVWGRGALKPVEGHVRTRHNLHGSIVGEVNSFHHLALSGCPPGYEVLARAEDEEIEAIRHLDLPWEGWMWHPEREQEFSLSDVSRARKLFGA